MFSSVTLVDDHRFGLDPQLHPCAASRPVTSRAAPTAHSNDGSDRPSSDL
jgi:hypothetical protein